MLPPVIVPILAVPVESESNRNTPEVFKLPFERVNVPVSSSESPSVIVDEGLLIDRFCSVLVVLLVWFMFSEVVVPLPFIEIEDVVPPVI